jgi:hypothetical protein
MKSIGQVSLGLSATDLQSLESKATGESASSIINDAIIAAE